MSSEEAVRADAMETVVEVRARRARRRGGIEGDARERGGKTRAVIGVGLWRARGVESDDARSSEGDARDGIGGGGRGDDERARVRDRG
jgi:hypothetical protein